MTQTDSSLTLDAVICGRCHAISPADDHTCPYCGADRHGAVFTSVADAASVIPVEESRDFVDLRDTGWLTRLARRKMVTSYPSLVEPGDEPVAPVRRPARKIMAVLVSGVVAGVAGGVYFYAQQDAEVAPTRSVSAAGAVGDGASGVQGHGDVDRPALARHESATASGNARNAGQAETGSASPERSQASPGDTAAGPVVSQAGSGGASPALSAHSRTFASATVEPAVTASTNKNAGASQPASASSATLASQQPQAATRPASTEPTASLSANRATTAVAPQSQSAATQPGPAAPMASLSANRAATSLSQQTPTTATHVGPTAPTTSLSANRAATSLSQQTQTTATQAGPTAPTTSLSANRAATSLSQQPQTTATQAGTTAPTTSLSANRAATSLSQQPQTTATQAGPTAPTTSLSANRATTSVSPQSQVAAMQPGPTAPTTSSSANRATPSLSPQPQTAAPLASLPSSPRAPQPQPQTTAATPEKSPPSAVAASARRNDDAPQQSASVAHAERTAAPAVARNVVAVRQALAAHDLAAARRHMRGVYSNQPQSPEVQQLAADLSRQERARDSAMANARSCSVNKEPACAVRNARRAVALDPRNPQAQTLLRQATAAQAEANTAYFRQASALPAPMQAAMTFDGRWSVAGRHGPATSHQDGSSSTFTIFGLGVPTVSKGRGDAH
ncbi:hypothetical protein P9239_15000 [Caballeronia sp. LZ062]|uniref:hypothetical protein n=1 Tax=unclassified Caballeronia TaxID=2646786 RepID=UPI00285A5F87|nr:MULTISPECIES: hypothetical protein [unclassified Caballeronia]MDR5853820.1 hypothetical protein [Caballeronia sp. LZ050]MDR5871648.1 hypothetical protein [Caballeronia sp. LZ062]